MCIPLSRAGPSPDLVHLARGERCKMFQTGDEVLGPWDVGHVNDLGENAQHLHLTKHVLATRRTQHQQFSTLSHQRHPNLNSHITIQLHLNAQELCFCRWRTGPLVIPTSHFSLSVLDLGTFTTGGENKSQNQSLNYFSVLIVMKKLQPNWNVLIQFNTIYS